jgi:ABC-type polysaccharide/polyol phosphate transport system ATPase subunit
VKGSIRLAGVRKVYRRHPSLRRLHTLKGALLRRGVLAATATGDFVALDGVDLEVMPGEAIALVGPNGSGKSTLLKLASGILRPTAGTVSTEGRVTALIELGAGFHPEITGRENVLINGMLLGLSRAEVERRLPEIVDFADIGDFIDQPVKTYSSGMYVRLGFSVAVAVEPDILLIDEVLAVGDAAFTRRCLDRLARMRRRGVTMVLVSHDLDLVRDFADRAVYLRRGEIVATGAADAVVARYRSDVAGAADEEEAAEAVAGAAREDGRRWGNGAIEIVSVDVGTGGVTSRVVPSGADCEVAIRYRVHRPVSDVVFGVAWHQADGGHVGGHNTELDRVELPDLGRGGVVLCRYPTLDLAPGEYLLDVAVHASDGLAYDYRCQVGRVRVTAAAQWPGPWAPPHRWEVLPGGSG